MKKSLLVFAGAFTFALTACSFYASAEPTAAPEFMGTWRYGFTPNLLEMKQDGTYSAHAYSGAVKSSGRWTLGSDCLILTDEEGEHFTDLSFTEDETLLDSEHSTELYAYTLPEVTKAAGDAFIGTWEYMDYPAWIVIHSEDTYEKFNCKGESSGQLKCIAKDGAMILLNADGKEIDCLQMDSDGYVVNSELQTIYSSELPEDFESYIPDGLGGEEYGYFAAIPYFGCWKYENYDLWLYIYDNGSYEWIFDNGDSDSGYWYMGDDCMFLYNVYGGGDSLVCLFDGDLLDGNGDRLYSDLAPFARYRY